MKRLAASHLIGNALLLWLGYYWLGLGESSGFYLAYSAVILLFFVLAALWLHATALVYFQRKRTLGFGNLAPLFVLALCVTLVYIGLERASYSFGHEAFVIGSYGTMKLRRPVAPSGVLHAFQVFVWVMRWLIVPIFALPLACEIANQGWKGFHKQAFQLTRRPLFWIEALLLLLLALWVPFKLFFWIPRVPNFPLEVVSVTARLGTSYLLFVAGLLTLEFLTGRPRTTKLNTVASP